MHVIPVDQFSWVNAQAYKEIKEDGHPIVIRILKEKGINSQQALTALLDALGRKPNVRSS